MRIEITITFTLAIIFLLMGCSNGGNSPLTPGENINNNISISSIPVGVIDRFDDGMPASGMGSLGLFQLYLDSQNQTAELVSSRTGALKDVLEAVDITNFLSLAPCTDCVNIKSVALDTDGNLVVSIGIKHPFDIGDPLKPIT